MVVSSIFVHDVHALVFVYLDVSQPVDSQLFSLRAFRLGVVRTRGLEDQRPCPWVCRLMAPGPPLGGSFWLKVVSFQTRFAPARAVVRVG